MAKEIDWAIGPLQGHKAVTMLRAQWATYQAGHSGTARQACGQHAVKKLHSSTPIARSGTVTDAQVTTLRAAYHCAAILVVELCEAQTATLRT